MASGLLPLSLEQNIRMKFLGFFLLPLKEPVRTSTISWKSIHSVFQKVKHSEEEPHVLSRKQF